MALLFQFVLRLSFGLALAMGLTSPRKVTSGYFRNHAYVLLGLNVLATLVAVADRERFPLWPPLAAAILSYLCGATWLYQKPLPGLVLLWLIAAASLAGAWLGQIEELRGTQSATLLWSLDAPTSGLLLGSTIAAMFLGHWYLNTPTMELAPLRKLLLLMAVAVAARAAVCAVGFAWQFDAAGFTTAQYIMLAKRWLAGLAGTALLVWMAWQTLKIPNTQSATGILSVAVIATFLGELTSQLLSDSTLFPV